MDIFGLFVIKQQRNEIKCYGAMFTCMANRAVHIEITHSLNSDSFIQALRPVFTCRGNIKVLYSDNGTNFVRCKNELKKAYKEIYNERILSLMQSLEETQWICTKYKVQDWKTRNYEGNRILERRVKNCAAY